LVRSATARAGFRGPAATRAPAGVKLYGAIELEAIRLEINLYGLRAVEKIFVNDVFVTIYVKLLVQIIWLIQSHGQAGTASAAFIQKNTDGPNVLAFKVGCNLFRRRWGNYKHGFLLNRCPAPGAHGCCTQGVEAFRAT
jgi:hypothetical protein